MTEPTRHVVVTGATGGLGVAVVEALLAEGYGCHLPMMETAAPRVAWAGHERVHAVGGVSLTDEAQVAAFFAGAAGDHGLWASIHLVGGFAMAGITETTLADWDRMHAMNGTTCFLSCREAVRAIRPTKQGGRIVNVAARPVLAPAASMAAYAASKAAVASLTQTLAVELASERILVNAIVPSIIDTPANRAAMPTADHDAWPKASELAAAIVALVSPKNALTSGALLPVYGRA